MKLYVVHESPISANEDINVSEASTFNISSKGFTALSARDLFVIGAKLLAIAASRMAHDGTTEPEFSEWMDEAQQEAETWAIANGIEGV